MAAKILQIDEAKLVRAAGGVIFRNGSRVAVRVALIHRPGYDDWTFPKGKLYPGEKMEEAALRETEEETGLRCRLVRPLGCTSYADHRGRAKVACYWVMEPTGGRFRPSAEVDELRWLTIDEALDQLSYRRDRALLRSMELEAASQR
jgi:8-oxo-dGTP diphosphatase